MKIIHFSHESIGSVDYELPPRLSETIERLPKATQEFVMNHFQESLKAFLLLHTGALKSKNSLKAFELIGATNVALLKKLIELEQKV